MKISLSCTSSRNIVSVARYAVLCCIVLDRADLFKVISGQHLPRARDDDGKEDNSSSLMDPYVDVSLHIPDWSLAKDAGVGTALTPKVVTWTSKVIKNNGYDPSWNQDCDLVFDSASDHMLDLVFVHFQVKLQHDDEDDKPVAQYCVPVSQIMPGVHPCLACLAILKSLQVIIIYHFWMRSCPNFSIAHCS